MTATTEALDDTIARNAREVLYLAVIIARQQGRAPHFDGWDVNRAVYEVFHPALDSLCDTLLADARKLGLAVEDDGGDLLPDVLDAVTDALTAAIWFGLTEAHMRLDGALHIPRRFLSAGQTFA